MSKTKEIAVEQYGLVERAATRREARAALEARIARVMDLRFASPRLFVASCGTALVLSFGEGWGYALVYASVPTYKEHLPCLHLGFATPAEAMRAARRHLAQLASTWQEASGVCDPQDSAATCDYFVWQAHYRHARADGKSDDEARGLAHRPRDAYWADKEVVVK